MTIYAFTDGASRGNPGESGVGVVLKDDAGKTIFSAGGYIGLATNNVAEYEALLICLRTVRATSCRRLIIHSDSELMVRQVQGSYRVRDAKLKKYYDAVQKLLRTAPFEFSIVHIDRALNKEADALANAGIDSKQVFTV